MGEFALIRRHFEAPAAAAAGPAPGVVLGIGDDCALLQPDAGQQLAVSTDALVEGVHFLPGADPAALGHKALAVNLSDLAAMGAEPLAFTLALTLPRADDAWLAAFSEGLLALARAHHCPLVGGDTTRGPLNLALTVFGQVPPGLALRRDGARPGDDIYASGALGEARLGLALALAEHRGDSPPAWSANWPPAARAQALQRLHRPTPRLALGRALRGVASAAADVSDGLLADLGHILARSGVGATVQAEAARTLLRCADGVPASAGPDAAERLRCVLAGGDDYELVFTAPAARRAQVQAAALAAGTPVTRLGQIDAEPGLRVLDAEGRPIAPEHWAGFDHFGPGA